MLYESYYGVSSLGDSLEHHGIKGQKWGVRRFQYENGILTPAGRARYDVGPREKTGKSARKSTAKNVAANALRGAAIGLGAASYHKLRTGNVSNPLPGMLKGAVAGAAVGAAGTAAYASSRNSKNSKKKLSAKELKERKAQRKEMAKKIAKGVAVSAAVLGTAYVVNKKLKDISVEKKPISDTGVSKKNEDFANELKKHVNGVINGAGTTNLKKSESIRNLGLNSAAKPSASNLTKSEGMRNLGLNSVSKPSASDLKKQNKDLFNKSIDYLNSIDDIDEYFTGKRKRR